MFGQNTIKGKSFFKEAEDELLVTSYFLSLQGEGPYQGRPALFIRLTHCSLDCSWCDAFFDEGNWFDVDELVSLSLNMIKTKYRNVEKCGIVVTGGEPTLQSNIINFLHKCNEAGVAFTQVESNGILAIDLPQLTTLVVSPKCSEKTGKYLIPHAKSLSKANCLKFIVSANPNSPYHVVPDWGFEWQRELSSDIYVSPMNMYRPAFLEMARQRFNERKAHNIDYRSTVDEIVSGWDDAVLDREQNKENHIYAFKYAVDNGLFLTLQMHLFGAAA